LSDSLNYKCRQQRREQPRRSGDGPEMIVRWTERRAGGRMKSFVAGHFVFPKALSFAIEAEERRQHVQSVTVSCCTKNVLQSCTAA
jgi:hypothetical protein